jgi:hypothetical protein
MSGVKNLKSGLSTAQKSRKSWTKYTQAQKYMSTTLRQVSRKENILNLNQGTLNSIITENSLSTSDFRATRISTTSKSWNRWTNHAQTNKGVEQTYGITNSTTPETSESISPMKAIYILTTRKSLNKWAKHTQIKKSVGMSKIPKIDEQVTQSQTTKNPTTLKIMKSPTSFKITSNLTARKVGHKWASAL